MNAHLRHDVQVLLQDLVEGKLPRNLPWSDVIELIGQVGEVQPHGHDEFVFVVGTQRAFFKRPHTHDLEVDEVARLRRFLRDAGLHAPAAQSRSAGRTVVVIDHHSARIYRNTGKSESEDKATVKPYDPFGFHRHLIHRKEAHYQGERVPEETSFYGEIAKDLAAAGEIIVIGHGTGTSSAADFLLEYLKKHDPAIASRIVANERLDLSALTETQIEETVKPRLVIR